MVVRWWPHNPDPAIASTRLRCHAVIAVLRERGQDVGLFDAREAAPDVLVLLKRYDASSVAAAEALRRRFGTRLALDLCDNHFYDSSGDPAWRDRAAQLRRAVVAVDRVVASTPTLAGVVREEAAEARVSVIGDIAEGEAAAVRGRSVSRASAEFALARLRRGLERSGVPRSRRLVWFGNHGSPNAEGGMTDLLRIRGTLEDVASTLPITLTVISNHPGKFRSISMGWRLPIRYLEWNATTFSRALRLHGVSVIPVGLNPFTACKTNNRVCTSLLHDLAVVADAVPSYCEFDEAIRIGDWKTSLVATLEDSRETVRRIECGRALVAARYGADAIGAQWLGLLESLRAGSPRGTPASSS
ncbi:MAG: hypothetical protein EHM60_03570 [Lysobacterales bacterium]|nr:MAG: hypothetical protein EHM60_03570 [Xanthomonadales bacterium]